MRDGHVKPAEGQVRFHAGYKGLQEPRRVIIEGQDYPVTRILSRKRIRDSNTGSIREIFMCRIDHRTVKVCVHADGSTAISIRESPEGT